MHRFNLAGWPLPLSSVSKYQKVLSSNWNPSLLPFLPGLLNSPSRATMPQFNPFSTWFHLKYFKWSYLQLPVILSPEVSPAPNPMLPVPSAVPPATLWPHCSGGIPVNPDPPHVRWAGSELQPGGAVQALRRRKNTALPSCLTLGKGGPFLFFFFLLLGFTSGLLVGLLSYDVR